jgi:cellulose synthase/poly-beta-1,6-N-acetylglucosamine synthase-like glycosyltransferase
MFLHCLCKNEYVIQIDTDYTFGDQVLEYLVHHGLKGGQTIGETEEHNQGFEKSLVCAKGGLPLITFLDADIVLPPPDIEFGEVLHALEWLMRSEMSGSGYMFFTVFAFSAL